MLPAMYTARRNVIQLTTRPHETSASHRIVEFAQTTFVLRIGIHNYDRLRRFDSDQWLLLRIDCC